MHHSPLDGTRFAVVQSLQASLVDCADSGTVTERSPGSRASAVIEQAIDYALSPRRTQAEPALLEHDVRRNARVAVRRTADVEARVLADIAAICAPAHQAFTGYVRANAISAATADRPTRPASVRTSGPGGKVAGTAIVSTITPEDEAVASDLERRLRNRVRSELGALAARVLDGMIDGESVPETAHRLGVSTRTVDRARNKTRMIASAVLGADRMAA